MALSTPNRTRLGLRALLLGACALGGLTSPAFAQDAAEAPVAEEAVQDDAATQPGDIVVTGSRVARSGFSAPTPTTIIGSELMEQRGSTNVATMLNEIPSFRGTVNPAASGIRTTTPGANYADLRGLGSFRTLTLVDGRRFVPSVPTASTSTPYQVDLNAIPSLMVDRVEVVTGGASAQWGSDAVSGVVNLILNTRFEGLKAEAQYGVSGHGDGDEYRIGALFGASFAGGRGHITIAGDYVKNDGIYDVYTRDWGRDQYMILTNPGSTVANGQPRQIISNNVRYGTITPGGLIVGVGGGSPASLVGTEFLAGGVPAAFVRGQYGTVTNALQIGGGNDTVTTTRGVTLTPKLERRTLFGHLEYEFSDSITGFADLTYGYSRGQSQTLPPRDQGTTVVTIQRDNAYLPASIAAQMPAGGTIRLGRIDYDLGHARPDVTNDLIQGTVGLRGDLGGGWKWDAHYSYGVNTYEQHIYGMRNKQKYVFAADAVNSGGQIVCRATIAGPSFNAAAAGCVPLNLFGNGSPSAAATAYVTGTVFSRNRYTQHAAAVNLRGDPFSTWAGPVSFATGVEYRSESSTAIVDPVAAANNWESGNGLPYSGSFNVLEGYAETVIPLARDMAFAKSFDFNAAVRHAKYSGAAGGQTTWKLGSTWEPIDGLRFRVARSRDIRAPSLFEQRSVTVQGLNVVYNGGSAFVEVNNTGNTQLQPEKSDTLTVGFVWTPSFVPRLQFSVDYYDISVKGAIDRIGQQNIIDQCAAGNTALCSYLVLSGATLIRVNNPYVNLNTITTRGFDGALSYRVPVDSLFGAPGSVSFNLSGTYTTDMLFGTPGAAVVQRAGENSIFNGVSGYAVPTFRGNASITVQAGRLSVTPQLLYTSAGKYNNVWTDVSTPTKQADINDNSIPAVAYVNLSFSYDILGENRLQLFGVVNNLFDKDPPPVPSFTSGQAANTVLYDAIGRYFRIGVRAKF